MFSGHTSHETTRAVRRRVIHPRNSFVDYNMSPEPTSKKMLSSIWVKHQFWVNYSLKVNEKQKSNIKSNLGAQTVVKTNENIVVIWNTPPSLRSPTQFVCNCKILQCLKGLYYSTNFNKAARWHGVPDTGCWHDNMVQTFLSPAAVNNQQISVLIRASLFVFVMLSCQWRH